MPSKPKPLAKPKKAPKASSRNAALITTPDPTVTASPDEHLAACVALEESGDKHRAGDVAKASRFYVKALEGYEAGLRVWCGRARGGGKVASAIFDMLYNLARLQYQITQHPPLRYCFPGTLPDQLRIALSSHRRALALVATLAPSTATATAYADVLFNTGQVLSSLAEAVGGDNSSGEEEARIALSEAAGLFQDCLARQKRLYEESVRTSAAAAAVEVGEDADVSGVDDDHVSREEDDEQDERWATVVEPVTKQSLLDTAVAWLEALGSLSVVLEIGYATKLQLIQNMGAVVVNSELHVYLNGQDADAAREAWLAVAKFKSAFLEAEFRQKKIDVQTFDQSVKEVFAVNLGPGVVDTQDYLCAHADALIAFTVAVAETSNTGTLRWTRLSNALDRLTEGSRLPSVEDMATLHIGRGDIEMLRLMLCRSGTLPDNLSNEGVQTTVLKNATTFYGAAVSFAQGTFRSALDQTLAISHVKAAVATGLLKADGRGLLAALVASKSAPEQLVKEVLDDMVDEGLVAESMLRHAGII